MFRILLIFLAGGCGCLLRYGVSGWVQRLGRSSFPVGTLAVNVVGCVLIGFLASLLTGPVLIREAYRLAILIGLLGGFTTFSTFGYETMALLRDRELLAAGAYVGLHLVLGFTAVAVGYGISNLR